MEGLQLLPLPPVALMIMTTVVAVSLLLLLAAASAAAAVRSGCRRALPLHWIQHHCSRFHRRKPAPSPPRLRLKLPPGSLGWPLLGETVRLLRCLRAGDAERFFAPRRSRHGAVFKTHLFGCPAAVVSGPAATALLSSPAALHTHQPLPYRKLLGVHSIVNLAAGQHHRLLRAALGGAGGRLAGGALKYLRLADTAAAAQMAGWRAGDRRRMDAEAYGFTFAVAAAAALGPRWAAAAARRGSEAERLTKLVTTALVEPPLDWPGFRFRRGMDARRRLDAMFQAEIDRRRSEAAVGGSDAGRRRDDDRDDDELDDVDDHQHHSESTTPDLLADMMAMAAAAGGPRDVDQPVFHDQHLKDTLQMLLIGGHDPSANTLTWIVNLLSRHPHCYSRLLKEHEEIRRSKTCPSQPLEWQDVEKMSYTTMVIQEALRFSSIAFVLQRTVTQDNLKLHGYDIPKGWKLILDVHELHHNPQNYSDPHTFDPSRFEKRPKPYTFIPFGWGSRMCLGKDMAMLQMCVFLHHLVLKCRWRVTDQDNARTYRGPPNIKNGVPFTVDSINHGFDQSSTSLL